MQELSYPKLLHIALTNKCNLDCFICAHSDYLRDVQAKVGHPRLDMDITKLPILAQAITHAEKISLTGYGEVFIYPHFEEALNYIFSLNAREHLIRIVTNGTLLSKRYGKMLRNRIDNIAISLNASNSRMYEEEMGFDFEKTLSRIQDFLSEISDEDRSRIELHFVCHRKNITTMTDFVRLASTLKISTVEFTPLMVVKPIHVSYTIMTCKEEFNESIDAAFELGKRMNVTVVGKRIE